MPSQPLHVSADSGRTFNLMGAHTTVKLTSADTGGAYILSEQTLQPGVGVPPHVHTREDEVFFVLEGEIEFVVGDKTVIGRAGDILHAPRDVVHGFRGAGSGPSRARFMAIPGDIEAMFDEMAGWPADAAPDVEKLTALCARFGIRFV
jgi:quercetin dioxygenase-like cupin family protein